MGVMPFSCIQSLRRNDPIPMKWYGIANHLPSKTQKFLASALGSPYLAVSAVTMSVTSSRSPSAWNCATNRESVMNARSRATPPLTSASILATTSPASAWTRLFSIFVPVASANFLIELSSASFAAAEYSFCDSTPIEEPFIDAAASSSSFGTSACTLVGDVGAVPARGQTGRAEHPHPHPQKAAPGPQRVVLHGHSPPLSPRTAARRRRTRRRDIGRCSGETRSCVIRGRRLASQPRDHGCTGSGRVESAPTIQFGRVTDHRRSRFRTMFEISYRVDATLEEHREGCQCFDAVSGRKRQAGYRGWAR